MIPYKRSFHGCPKMVNLVGYRFWPTDNEIFDHYLRLKNLGDTSSSFDEVMNTLDIYSFDPWDLPLQSKIKSEDRVWYFFSRKENKYKRDERQGRKTKSGFWKKTGVTMNIMSKSSGSNPREKIGEKRVLVFHSNKNLGGSKSDWVMHEYQSVLSSPAQMIKYTICKVQFKGEASDLSSSAREITNSHTSTTHMNNSEELTSIYEGSCLDRVHIQELQDPCPLSGFLNVQQETQHEDLFYQALSSHGWKSLLDFCNNMSIPKL